MKYKCKINKNDQYLHYLNKIYMLKCISKNIVYLLNHAYLLNYKCKINKKDQYLHYLNKIYMLKCVSKNIVFTCIPFKPHVFIELQV